MRWLLISDLHANLPALESVLKRAKEVGYDRIMCAGDLVGYYPWANEVCDWVRESVDLCVMGNHDAVVAGLVSPEYFNGWAKISILWTAEHLSETNREFIKNLPLKLELPENDCLVHDTPVAPMSMYYITDPYDAVEVFRKTDYRITIYGHTHLPALFVFNGAQVMGIKPENLFPLRGDWRYLINPGSVGQPRDGVPKAAFAVWDTEEGVVHFERVEFNVDAVVKKMKEAGLPLELAYRLYEGY